MVKKIFLLTFMAIGMTACSKSDDTPTNNGDNNKLLGTWVGTVEVIARKQVLDLRNRKEKTVVDFLYDLQSQRVKKDKIMENFKKLYIYFGKKNL